MNYFWTAMSSYDDKFTGLTDKDTTPATLRAAAKVLEEKAKELDKPAKTTRQTNAINYAYDKGLGLISIKNGKQIALRGIDFGDDAGTPISYKEWTETEILSTSTVFCPSEGWNAPSTTATLAVYKDEYGDWEPAVVYPES